MGTLTSLDDVRDAASILVAIRQADDLTIAASRDGGPRAVRLLAQAALDRRDQVTAVAAIHALAQVFDESADDVLVALLGENELYLREHAAWAIGSRLPRFDAITPLITMVICGGFSGMLAQRTLEHWAASVPDQIALALEGALLGTAEVTARERLVETMGLVIGRIPDRLLRRVATDDAETLAVRAAAVAALGDRTPAEQSIRIVTDLSFGSDALADVARLALLDLTVPSYPRAPWSQGSTIAQLFLHADIDRELSQVGSGDNGGIATLLVRLGDALVTESDKSGKVERVLTLSRGDHAAALSCLADVSSTLAGHEFAAVPFIGEAVASIEAWPRRIATQRGIRRILRAAGTVDAIHLRMADVGSLAASTVARELDIPVVFTLAPDPHSVINALDTSGTVNRSNFGIIDATEHFWFRARLVQRLAGDAAHTVLFPRPDLKRDMLDLVGIDIEAHPERHSVIAEGIDLAVIRQARIDVLATGNPGAELAELDALLATLPAHRRHLPLAITVGRLHRVKGMATLVDAWAGNRELREQCNLLIVGGDLVNPTCDEQGQLELMNATIPLSGAAEQGLLLAGHRSNDTVARWLAAARFGRAGLAAPHGIYVCSSMKEEFGIAILEAMATGLTVVTPLAGGPATYVEEGVTGFLVNTIDQEALGQGITAALQLAGGPFGEELAERAWSMVESTFTIQAMASTLSRVYRNVADAQEPSLWALSNS